MEYTKNMVDKNIIDYFYNENLDSYFNSEELENIKYKQKIIEPYYGNSISEIAIPIDIEDLVKIHQLLRKRKVFTVLEYGIGYSTIIMADALHKNKTEFENSEFEKKNNIRCNHKFEIHSVDTSEFWISRMTKKIKDLGLENIVNLYFSECKIGTFNDRICHFYEKHPNVVPDFIYLDGPSPLDVSGNINGIDFTNNDRTVMSGDLLIQEPTFIPGLFILIDGRTNNANFLKNNFQRKYIYHHDIDNDIHTFELKEPPLGIFNIAKLEYSNLI